MPEDNYSTAQGNRRRANHHKGCDDFVEISLGNKAGEPQAQRHAGCEDDTETDGGLILENLTHQMQQYSIRCAKLAKLIRNS